MRSTSFWGLAAVAAVALGCGSVSGGTGSGGSGGGGETGGSHGTGGSGAGGEAGGAGGAGTGGSTATGGHGGAGTGSGGHGGAGGACGVCAGALYATCPADVATASMCGTQNATCCDANDVQWQCGLCAAETCHWIQYCPATGTGGSGGQGGHGGAGAGGQGGGAGAGGSIATGGQGGHAGGAGGSSGAGKGTGGQAGGQGGNNGATCAQLATDYATAFTQARMCNTSVSTAQCTHLVVSSLSCGCQGWVNDTSQLDPIAAQWTAAGCVSELCPVACIAPGTSGACAPINSGDVCMAAN